SINPITTASTAPSDRWRRRPRASPKETSSHFYDERTGWRWFLGWRDSALGALKRPKHALSMPSPISYDARRHSGRRFIRFLQCPIYPPNGSGTARQENQRPKGADARAAPAGNPRADCDPVQPYADTGARSHVRATAS